MTTAHTIRCRKAFRCYDSSCSRPVQPGEDYVRYVAFPNDNDLGNTGFWILKACMPCATEHRPAPPRRTPRRNKKATAHA